MGNEILTGPFNIVPSSRLAASSPVEDRAGLVLLLAAAAGRPAGDPTEVGVAAAADEPAGEAGPGLGLAVADTEACFELEGVPFAD